MMSRGSGEFEVCFLARQKHQLSLEADCLVRGALRLDKQVALVAGFEPGYWNRAELLFCFHCMSSS